MTIKLKIENFDEARCLVATPYDDRGGDSEPLAADPVVILPGQSAILVVHSMRSLHVAEGDQVREAPPVAASEPEASEGNATEEGAGAAA